MLFSELPIDHRIVKNLNAAQLERMTEVQQRTIVHALLNKDILAASKTGSGKTLAFAIPIVHRLLSQKAFQKADPRALILAPTRELAKQVFGVLKQLTQNTPVQTNLVVGGENYNDQAKLLKRHPHIIIGTAGRIADHLQDRHFFLNGLELLVLDEADRMLELGFKEQLTTIHAQANHRKRQTMMFSATIEQATIKQFTQVLLKNPQNIVVDAAAVPHSQITQLFYFSDGVEHKDQQLLTLLDIAKKQQSIVFTATREDTARLTDLVNNQHLLNYQLTAVPAVFLHGELLQQQRKQVIQDFSQGKYKILITTDLAARGLDIRNVGQVINYDLPKFAEEYIHRIGRTGRAGDTGRADSLVSKKDWASFEFIKRQYLKQINFCALNGLEAKFKGKASKPSKPATKPKKSNPAKAQSNIKINAKRIKPLQSTDIGHTPIKRKARAQKTDTDDN